MFLALEEFRPQQEPLDIACAQHASSTIFGTPGNFLCLFVVISFVLLPFTGSLCLLKADYFLLKLSMLVVAYKSFFLYYNSVQSLSCIWLFVTLWTAARQASLTITNSQSLLKLMSIESVMPSNHLILCRPLLLPSVFPSIRVFSDESVLHIRWSKYWSFSISPWPVISDFGSLKECCYYWALSPFSENAVLKADWKSVYGGILMFFYLD